MRGVARVLASLAMTTASCAEPVFHCSQDGNCREHGRAGVCVAPGYCAFEDDRCPSELAYGELSPAGLAGDCVPPESGTGSSSDDVADATSAPASTNADDSTSQDASSSGATTCPLASPCVPVDPCALAGECDATGVCVATDLVACDDPPSACWEPIGACDSRGVCEYTPRAVGEACSDGDGCTVGDGCDGDGTCVAGDLCPNTDPCLTVTCLLDACVPAAVADGTSCGDEAAARCCGGACVDISSDTLHCGGCNTPCAEDLDCESISETSTCEVAPEATSGRCRCQFSNAQCPLGQLCRTVEPYTDRCVPPASENCDGVRYGVDFCPSYCGY